MTVGSNVSLNCPPKLLPQLGLAVRVILKSCSPLGPTSPKSLTEYSLEEKLSGPLNPALNG